MISSWKITHSAAIVRPDSRLPPRDPSVLNLERFPFKPQLQPQPFSLYLFFFQVFHSMVWFHDAKHKKRSQPCCRFYLTSGRWKECCNTDTEARLQEVIRLGSCSELLCALMCSVSTRKTIKRSNWFELSQAAGQWNEKNEATWAFIRQMKSAPRQWSLCDLLDYSGVRTT